MNIRWSEFIVALMVAAWLGLFTLSCLPPTPPPEVESGSSARSSQDAPLDRPGSDMEQQAEQGELAPPAHEVDPGAHHN